MEKKGEDYQLVNDQFARREVVRLADRDGQWTNDNVMLTVCSAELISERKELKIEKAFEFTQKSEWIDPSALSESGGFGKQFYWSTTFWSLLCFTR